MSPRQGGNGDQTTERLCCCLLIRFVPGNFFQVKSVSEFSAQTFLQTESFFTSLCFHQIWQSVGSEPNHSARKQQQQLLLLLLNTTDTLYLDRPPFQKLGEKQSLDVEIFNVSWETKLYLTAIHLLFLANSLILKRRNVGSIQRLSANYKCFINCHFFLTL